MGILSPGCNGDLASMSGPKRFGQPGPNVEHDAKGVGKPSIYMMLDVFLLLDVFLRIIYDMVLFDMVFHF